MPAEPLLRDRLRLALTASMKARDKTAVAAHVQPLRRHPTVTKVAVPKLVGQWFGRSVRELNRHGLRQNSAGFPGSDSSPALHGCTRIISQAPAPGTKVPEHSTIHVTIGMTPSDYWAYSRSPWNFGGGLVIFRRLGLRQHGG